MLSLYLLLTHGLGVQLKFHFYHLSPFFLSSAQPLDSDMIPHSDLIPKVSCNATSTLFSL